MAKKPLQELKGLTSDMTVIVIKIAGYPMHEDNIMEYNIVL